MSFSSFLQWQSGVVLVVLSGAASLFHFVGNAGFEFLTAFLIVASPFFVLSPLSRDSPTMGDVAWE